VVDETGNGAVGGRQVKSLLRTTTTTATHSEQLSLLAAGREKQKQKRERKAARTPRADAQTPPLRSVAPTRCRTGPYNTSTTNPRQSQQWNRSTTTRESGEDASNRDRDIRRLLVAVLHRGGRSAVPR